MVEAEACKASFGGSTGIMRRWRLNRAPPSTPQSLEPVAADIPARTPEGVTLYAVGDVHGRADLLSSMLTRLREQDDGPAARVLIMLGDYIDRGPQSDGVIDQVLTADGFDRVCALRGNHEQALLTFLRDPAMGPRWCEHGGLETLRAYGVQPPRLTTDLEGWASTSRDLGDALPQTHRDFLHNLQLSVSYGDYFFAHAGARPGLALDEQSAEDLLGIRDEFLDDASPFEQVVVHGHTPSDEVHSDHRRIGIDTGAYVTGVLTAVRLSGPDRQFLQVSVAET